MHLAAGQSGDVMAAVLNDTGTALAWRGVFGGSRADSASDIALGPAGHRLIVGSTESTDFPAVSPLQSSGSLPLRRSTDGGVGFEIIQGIQGYIASMAFDPVDPNVVYAGSSATGVVRERGRGTHVDRAIERVGRPPRSLRDRRAAAGPDDALRGGR